MAPCDVNEVVDRALMLVRHHLEISGIQARVAGAMPHLSLTIQFPDGRTVHIEQR